MRLLLFVANWVVAIATVSVLLPAQDDLQGTVLSEFIRRIVTRESMLFSSSQAFTFDYQNSIQRFSADGRLVRESTEEGEVYFGRGGSVLVPLLRNGRQLREKDVGRARSRAVDRMTFPPGEVRSDRPSPGFQYRNVRMSLIDILKYCRVSEQNSSSTDGVAVLRFETCNSPWPTEAHFRVLDGIVMIRSRDSSVLSWEARIASGTSRGNLFFQSEYQDGPDQMRWIRFQRMNLAAAPEVFPKDRVNLSNRWSNWRQFGVDNDPKESRSIRP